MAIFVLFTARNGLFLEIMCHSWKLSWNNWKSWKFPRGGMLPTVASPAKPSSFDRNKVAEGCLSSCASAIRAEELLSVSVIRTLTDYPW